MAEQLKNSRTTPTCTLTSASITAGTSTSFTVSSASGLPASGTFRLLFKGTSSSGSDDAIAVVGAISGTTCSSVTWEEVGDQTTFTSGAELVLDLTAGGLTAYVSENAQPLDSDLTAIAALSPANDDVIQRKSGAWTNRTIAQLQTDLTGVLHTTGAETAAGVKTFTDKIIAKGSALSGFTYTPGVSFDSAYPKAGIYHATGNLILFVESSGTQIAALNLQPTGATFNVPFSLAAPMTQSGTYWDGSGTPYTADITVAPCLTVYTDSASANVDITLPDPYNNPGLCYWIIDLGSNASVNNIVIACGDDLSLGTTVEGASTYTMSANGEAIFVRADFNATFDNANWKILSRRVP